MVIIVTKKTKKNKKKKIVAKKIKSYKNKLKKQITKIKKKINCKTIKQFIKQYNYLFIMAIPFLLIDIMTRIFGRKINFFNGIHLVPTLFTIIWIGLIIGLSIFCEKKKGKIIYSIFFIIAFLLYLTNNVYYSMTNSFFGFNLLQLASEGSSYIMDAILNCNILVYIFAIIIILTFILGLKYFPKNNQTDYKKSYSSFYI